MFVFGSSWVGFHSYFQIPQLAGPKSVSRWLRKAGIYSCWAARKPLLSTLHIEKRLAFANAHMGFDFSKVVFSDEKIWRIRPGGRVRVFRRKGERYNPKYTQKTVGRSVGVMVWCAINSAGQVLIKRCPDTVDALAYQQILKESLPFIRPRSVYYVKPYIHRFRNPSQAFYRARLLPAGRCTTSHCRLDQEVDGAEPGQAVEWWRMAATES